MRPFAATLERIAPVALLALPVSLMVGAAAIEACLALLIAAFLLYSAARRDWAWLRQPWMVFAILWWLWLLACSLPGIAAEAVWPRWTLQAVLTIRLPLGAAAIVWLLAARPALGRWLHGVVVLVALYVLVQLVLQFVTGQNLFGHPTADNGLLSGPFDRPRAGATLVHLFFPLLLPPVFLLLARGQAGWFAGTALLAAGVAVILPIGQRMPILLVGLGLVVVALLRPQLRRPAMVAALAGAATLAAGWVAFPAAQHRLVVHFTAQMESFPTSHYGLIYTRAAAMAAQHPLHGRGFAAFRTGCTEPRYFAPALGSPALGDLPADGGGADICVTHAHNLYLEALTDAGWPGLSLFAGFVLAVLLTLARGIRATPDPRRIGLFIAALLHLWPLAASNAFTNPYMGGWFVLLLGWGLALAKNTTTSSHGIV